MLGKKSILFVVLLCVNRCAFSQNAATSPISAPEKMLDAGPLSSSAEGVENWDKVSLRGNELRPQPLLVGQVDTFPEFTRELLRVQWRGGDPIDLYIVRPKGISKPPVILYLYGYPGEAIRFQNNSLCKTVTSHGFAAVSFSSMLTGQRYHDVPMKEWFVSELRHSLVGTTHDVQMVLNYLASRGDFDMSRVGFFGEGSGGTIALLSASVDPRIKAVDVLNPWGDWNSWFSTSRIVPEAERANYANPDFLESIASLDPVVVLPRLANLPLRLQQNLWDSAKTPASSRERIAAALPANANLSQYKDEKDYFDRVGNNGKILDWMYEQLRPRSASE